MEVLIEEILTYAVVIFLCGFVVWKYLKSQKLQTFETSQKIEKAKEEGRYEPVSLHPYIDLSACIGSGACVSACPEKDILGLVNGKAAVINASSCVGHGACFHTCPVEAISLRIGTEKRGVDLPHVNQNFETNVKGIYIAGELGGMGLIKNSVEQGKQAVQYIVDSWKNAGGKADYDLVIVGAGPAGISAALTAQKNGLKFKVLEQYTLGGTVYSFPRSKIVMTNPMDLPLYGKVKLFDTSKDELLKIWNAAISKNNIQIQENSKVEQIIPQEDHTFRVEVANGENYISDNVLIAIGRRGTPRKLNIPGESLPKVFYRLLEPENISGQRIVVVGGGDSAIESAMLLMDQNEVILSYRKGAFSRIKQDNRDRIKKAQESNKLKVIYNSNLISIDEFNVTIQIQDEEEQKVPNDFVYIFAGGELPTTFLQKAGIEIQKRFGYIVKSYKNKD